MKTAILVTARLKSTRLPLKAIKMIKDKPMIVHLLDRLKLSQQPESIIICTSDIRQDDPLEEIAKTQNVKCFRGHPDDVLQRLTDAARQFGLETIINCTADNPFVDPIYIDRLLNYHISNNFDYSISCGLPFGTFAYALSYQAMVRACNIKDEIDTEVWGGYFTDTGLFSHGELYPEESYLQWPELRLTVDTPEDFELITKIFDALYISGSVFSLQSIINFCRDNPEILKINSSIRQKKGIPIKVKASYREHIE